MYIPSKQYQMQGPHILRAISLYGEKRSTEMLLFLNVVDVCVTRTSKQNMTLHKIKNQKTLSH